MLKVLKHLKSFWLLVFLALSLLMVRVLCELFLPAITAEIVNVGIVNGDTPFILRMGGRMLLVAAIAGISMLLSGYFSARAASGFASLLRETVFTKVESFSLKEFDEFGTASLIARTTNDITQMQVIVYFGMRMLARAPAMGIGGVIMTVSKDVSLSMVFALAVPTMFLLVYLIGRRGFPLFRILQKKIDNLNLTFRESLTGIRVIRAFNRNDYEKNRFQKANKEFADTAIRVNRIMSIMNPVMMVLMNFTIIGVVWFGANRIDQGFIQVGDLMAFIQYGMHIMFALVAISMMFVWIPRASASAARINEILDVLPEIVDGEVVKAKKEEKGKIEFRDVTFSYSSAQEPALSNLSFTIPAGKMTAIVGGTGSGKSTIANLLMRFYDVDSGSILMDGVDIKDLSQKDLREEIGFVSQKAIIFSGSVQENLLFGNQAASMKEVSEAARIAQADTFISELKNGFSTEIAQGGTNLSGGQKQRLAIARAIVKKPHIYIFDDSFSALDFKTDARLRKALKEEITEATVIIIAQRINTIAAAEQIIVLDEGRIVGIGTHNELKASNRVYREIVASQVAEEEIA